MKISIKLPGSSREQEVEYMPIMVGAFYTESPAFSINTLLGKQFKEFDLDSGEMKPLDLSLNLRYQKGRFCVETVTINDGGMKGVEIADVDLPVVTEHQVYTFFTIKQYPGTVFVDRTNRFSLRYRNEIDKSAIRFVKTRTAGREDLLMVMGDGYTVSLFADNSHYDEGKLLLHRDTIVSRLRREFNKMATTAFVTNRDKEELGRWFKLRPVDEPTEKQEGTVVIRAVQYTAYLHKQDTYILLHRSLSEECPKGSLLSVSCDAEGFLQLLNFYFYLADLRK